MSESANSMQPVLLQAQGIHKEYVLGGKAIHVLHGADLTVHAGERISIMGASGSGKSTLLHILGALDHPTAGYVLLEGRALHELSSRQRDLIRRFKVGFVFQSYYLLPELDVLDNVVLPAMADMCWLTRAESFRERGRHLLEQVGLAERMTHHPLELSGGEQQRAALARALMNEPDLLLMDEPTGNLDEATGEQILDYIMKIVHDSQRTLVMVTHDQQVAKRCDHRYMLREGVLFEH